MTRDGITALHMQMDFPPDLPLRSLPPFAVGAVSGLL